MKRRPKRNRIALAFMAGPATSASPDYDSKMSEADAALERAQNLRLQQIEVNATIRALAGCMSTEEQA